MKLLVLIVTTTDGDLLDRETLQVPDDTKAIEYRAINTTIPKSGLHDVLTTGDLSKFN